MTSKQGYVEYRNNKIMKVANSLKQAHKLYQHVNDLVDAQGVTLHKIQNNVADSRANTAAAKKEMQQALSKESSLNDKFKQGDCSLMCLLIWFFVVVVMFFIDVQMSNDYKPYSGRHHGNHYLG